MQVEIFPDQLVLKRSTQQNGYQRFFMMVVHRDLFGGASIIREELWLNLGDAHHQAARFSVSAETSTPSLNLIPSMTFGNWFLPLRRSHFFDAA